MLLWKALGKNEREVIEELWKRRDASISFAEAESVLIGRLGEPLWNAVSRLLAEHGLMEKQTSAVRRASRSGRPGAVFGNWELTEKGRSLMAWRQRLVEKAASASGAESESPPDISSAVLEEALPVAFEKRWQALTPLERSVLERLWVAAGYCAPETILMGLVGVRTQESWRAAIETLRERRLIHVRAPLYGTDVPTIVLPDEARRLMAWRTRRAETEQVFAFLIDKAEWAVVNLQNVDALSDKELREGIDRWQASVLEVLIPNCSASDVSHFRVLGSFKPDGLFGRTPEERLLRNLVSEKVKRLRDIARKLEDERSAAG